MTSAALSGENAEVKVFAAFARWMNLSRRTFAKMGIAGTVAVGAVFFAG
jgi:hypothetical protein